jgi:hypothetical protein
MKTYQTEKMGWLTWATSLKVEELEIFRPGVAVFKEAWPAEILKIGLTTLGPDPRHEGSWLAFCIAPFP